MGTNKKYVQLTATALFTLLMIGSAVGQKTVATAELRPVTTDGFYHITISPEHSTLLTADFANLRVLENGKTAIPYVVRTDEATAGVEFVEYPLTQHSTIPDCCTNIVIDNRNGKSLNNVTLKIKNADVHKEAVLSASDDQRNWYALKDKLYLEPIYNTADVYETRVLDFPLTNYKYYKLTIDDSATAPLNILAVGYYKSFRQNSVMVELPVVSRARTEISSSRKTRILVNLGESLWIDRISITGSGSPFFLRKAAIYRTDTILSKKGKPRQVVMSIGEGQLSHEDSLLVDMAGLKTDHVIVEISNEDNPPLRDIRVSLFQKRRNVIVWLEQGKEYQLAFLDETATKPQYDLTRFESKIPSAIKTVVPAAIVRTAIKEKPVSEWKNEFVLWGVIIGVILILGSLSFRMARETKEQK
jgi:hypothetical protein